MTKIKEFWLYLITSLLCFLSSASFLIVKDIRTVPDVLSTVISIFGLSIIGTLFLCPAVMYLVKDLCLGKVIEFRQLKENQPFIAINQLSNHIWTIHKVSRRDIIQTDYYVQLPLDKGCELKHGDDLIKKDGRLFKLNGMPSTDDQPILEIYGNYYKGQIIHDSSKKPKTS